MPLHKSRLFAVLYGLSLYSTTVQSPPSLNGQSAVGLASRPVVVDCLANKYGFALIKSTVAIFNGKGKLCDLAHDHRSLAVSEKTVAEDHTQSLFRK